jgi:hypothetical protein
MTARGRRGRLIAALAGALLILAAQAAGEDFGFMPKGGRALLLGMAGTPPDAGALREIAQSRRTEAEWRAFAAARGKTLSERELDTLAAYLAVNMPLPEDLARRGALAEALPPDGRDLAWNQCQFCHSLFTSYLTQMREVQAWRNMFQSPFHRELKMSPREREEFARYSAINMPMKIEDVPPDLRF